MKFGMLIGRSEEEWEARSETEQEFATLIRWWADLRARVNVVASARLASPRTARTVSWRDKVPVVTDGPYVEAKESVGGILVVDVESESQALEIAKDWPVTVGYRLEVRPVVEL